MSFCPLAAPLLMAAVLGLGANAGAQDVKESTKAQPPDTAKAADAEKGKEREKPKLEKATFGGGCFWCVEAVYEQIKGVKSAVSGYAGGSMPDPTYEQVSTGNTGHAEVVQLEFDPSLVTYEKLLEIFFKTHDPTTLNSQGPDFGTQYRSIILYSTEAQKTAAEALYKKMTKARIFRSPIVTELVPLATFYPAEEYHQNYYRTHRSADYCRIYIDPKIRKLQKTK